MRKIRTVSVAVFVLYFSCSLDGFTGTLPAHRYNECVFISVSCLLYANPAIIWRVTNSDIFTLICPEYLFLSPFIIFLSFSIMYHLRRLLSLVLFCCRRYKMAAAPAAKTHSFSKEQISEYKEQFDAFDEDSSGTIEAKELKSVLEKCGQEVTDAQVKVRWLRIELWCVHTAVVSYAGLDHGVRHR